MHFDWRWIVVGIAALWCVGWVYCAAFMFLRGPGVHDASQDKKDRLLGAVLISAFLWPVLLPSARRHRAFEADIDSGRRPKWLVMAEGEQKSGQWKLPDGSEFSASPVGGTSDEPTVVQAGFDDDSTAEKVECRVRMIAPEEGTGSEWTLMEFKELKTPDGSEDAENDDEQLYEAVLPLSRGKYRVNFRVWLHDQAPEECGPVTVIVSDAEDYRLDAQSGSQSD